MYILFSPYDSTHVLKSEHQLGKYNVKLQVQLVIHLQIPTHKKTANKYSREIQN